mmetsp:Transcript_39427/g.86671  ORF Transcript_39427/g.86671 Transcript_39427/m.86671 type:complete len:146 (-) Transcript_39427:203-640(-)
MCEPFFSLGRVLVADSWFGSVACALALCKYVFFMVMNVKTAHKNFPKDELLAVVGEIKGNSADARATRHRRRGTHAAFVREFKVGPRRVNIVAAGHNKKVPLSLVATASSMIPGTDHEKVWTSHHVDGTTSYHHITTPQPSVHES